MHGEVRLRVHLPDPVALEGGRVRLGDVDYVVRSTKWLDGNTAVVALTGVSHRDQAEALVGETAQIDPEWFDDDLPLITMIGTPVVDDADDRLIGVVTDVLHNGAQPILAIGEGADEKLVPLVDEFVVEITEAQIRIRPIPGLID